MDATTRSHTTCSRRRDQAKDLGARLTTPASPRRPSPLRSPHPAQWSADQGRPILLQRDGPTPAQPAVRREPAAHPRRGIRLHTHAQRQAPAGQDSPSRRAIPCHETGESVFQGQIRRVIIRGTRRRGRNAGNRYERHDYLPVTALEISLSRQNDAWSEAQIARNVKEAVLRQLGQPEANEPIYMISGETYFLHPTNEWYSSSSMQVIDNRMDTQIRLRQLLGALREVSYQLFAGDQILASAFEERPDMLCVPRQLAELSLEDILQNFDAICSGDWRQRGVSPAEIRTFCVWRNAPMFFVDCRGRLLDCFQPYRRKKWPQPTPPGTDTLSSTKAPGPWWAPEFSEWKPWAGEIASGHFWSEDRTS